MTSDIEWKIEIELEGIRWHWRIYWNGSFAHSDYSDYKWVAQIKAALWIAEHCADQMEAD